jgi:Na+-translocating ferredoxin:NAD+ oxidoreductase RnfG subunit
MFRRLLQLRLLLPAIVGLAALASGSGCAGSGSTRAVGIDSVRNVFPSATEIVAMPTDAETVSSARSGKTVVSEIRGPSHVLGYLVESQVVGRSGPFGIAVLLNERHVVKRATVVSYPWSHGREVGRRSFTGQFDGKGPEDAIEIGKDIDAVTGATISCTAMTGGVRKAVELLAKSTVIHRLCR